MDYDPHLVECRDCEWSQSMPNRDTAVHAKRVHESEYPGHNAFVDPIDEDDGDSVGRKS